MKQILIKITAILGGLVLLGLLCAGIYLHNEFEKLASDDPLVWKSAIDDLVREDAETVYPPQSVLFVGSSSIRFWSTLEEDMAPVHVIKRGFGGAKLSDVIHYADRIIWPYNTKSIVLFAGTNDITGRPNDKTPEELLELLRDFVQQMERKLPGATLYYLPITPTSSRWEIWPEAERANQLVLAYARQNNNVIYIDTTPYFLNEDGSVNKDLLFLDGIHLNSDGYAVWTELLRPMLLSSIQSANTNP